MVIKVKVEFEETEAEMVEALLEDESEAMVGKK